MAALAHAVVVTVGSVSLGHAPTSSWPWPDPQQLWFPPRFNMLNVRDFGARGDGVTDDTQALQAAINATQGFQTLFVPSGQYVISRPLQRFSTKPGSSKVEHFFMTGESVATTALVLTERCPGFQNVSSPAHMLHVGAGVAQNFFNIVENLQFVIGDGNPGAVGVRFDANNMGALRNVSIVGTDAAIGLDMSYSDQIGPCLVKYLHVQGCRVGVKTAFNVDSVTFDRVILEGQLDAGVVNLGQVISIRGLEFRGNVTAIQQHSNEGNVAFLQLVDSVLTATVPGAVTAINGTDGMMAVRNVQVNGFAVAITHQNYVVPPPPPPATCAASTMESNKWISGSYALHGYYDRTSTPTVCCSLCNAWNANASAVPCDAWGVVNQTGAHDFGVCQLWHCYGGVKDCKVISANPGLGTAIGLMSNVSSHVDSGMPMSNVSSHVDSGMPIFTPVITVPAGWVSEWHSHPVVMLFPEASQPTSLNLSYVPAPEPALPSTASDWADGLAAADGGPNGGNCTCKEVKLNGTRIHVPDCAPLIQRALNSGKSTVFFGAYNTTSYCSHENVGGYMANDPVWVPRTVTRIILSPILSINLTIAAGTDADPPLVIERVGNDGSSIKIHHVSKRAVVLRDCAGFAYTNAGCNTTTSPEPSASAGPLFLEDTVTGQLEFCNGQQVHATQLNTESPNLDIVVRGAGTTLRVHGYKIEKGESGLINVTDGAQVQVDGTFAYTTESSKVHATPAFAVMNAKLSVSYREYNADCKPFLHPVLEQRGTDVRILPNNFSIPGLEPGHGNAICDPPAPASGVCLYSGVPIE
eukprot:m.26530 g.26530  ORF g.26530 m.26530 type:complete len:808 (-) comp4321_c0_seq1:271-2694(-)